MKVLFVVSEMVPFAKTGGLADVAGALPLALEAEGVDVRVCLPKYREVDVAGLDTQIGQAIQVHFIDLPTYFDREGLYGTPRGDHVDNLERFSAFSRAALEWVGESGWIPDVIHCHDWQTALIPVYLKTLYKQDARFERVRTVLTIHNLAYQGLFPKREFADTGLDVEWFQIDGLEYYGKVNLLKGGLLFADQLTTVSANYALEIQSNEYGCGLDGVLRVRRADLTGILNGIDEDVWNPATDPALPANFSSADPAGKVTCKASLQRDQGLAVSSKTPLLGIITRLADQKGLDLLVQALDELWKMDLQLIVLGTGHQRYQKIFKEVADQRPGRASVHLTFDDQLARQIYAGSDFFLMPSRYEPCGLGQMFALRYGSVPIVRRTGGLADTIDEWNAAASTGNGFLFEAYASKAFVGAVTRAIKTYRDTEQWSALQQRALSSNWSWARSAREYVRLYEDVTAMPRSELPNAVQRSVAR